MPHPHLDPITRSRFLHFVVVGWILTDEGVVRKGGRKGWGVRGRGCLGLDWFGLIGGEGFGLVWYDRRGLQGREGRVVETTTKIQFCCYIVYNRILFLLHT